MRLTVMYLDAGGAVVAWAFVQAIPHGDGGFYAVEPFVAVVERETSITERVVHWADLHVAQRVPCALDARPVGTELRLVFPDALLRFTTPEWPVPGVTIRGNATVTPRAGQMGAH